MEDREGKLEARSWILRMLRLERGAELREEELFELASVYDIEAKQIKSALSGLLEAGRVVPRTVWRLVPRSWVIVRGPDGGIIGREELPDGDGSIVELVGRYRDRLVSEFTIQFQKAGVAAAEIPERLARCGIRLRTPGVAGKDYAVQVARTPSEELSGVAGYGPRDFYSFEAVPETHPLIRHFLK